MFPNWFETFFDGLALDIWRNAVTPEQTVREAEFLAERLLLEPGMAVLDVPCGNGRHAIELARRGMRMTGIDLSSGFLEEARKKAPHIEWVRCDMRKLPWRAQFDAAYCWGNSFGYFDHDNCRQFLHAAALALKPGGRFMLESGTVSESLLPVMQPERNMRLGDLDFHSRMTYDAVEGRMDITYTFTRGKERETKPVHQWVHSAAEIGRMLRRAGLELVAAFGDPEGAPYRLGSPQFVALAKRPDQV
ncbi:MAG: methyltransferase domain-containing protein [Acidobacteriaceae bacterium]|nr:methyltransferase domain-containing protein [Acidobacteriaceae bacterium]